MREGGTMSTLARITTPVAVRIVTGLMQGLGLCVLYQASESRTWPATDGLVFAPLLVIACLLPIVILMGVGSMRARTLGIWTLGAALLLVGLTIHDVFRDPDRLGSMWSLWTLGSSMGGTPDLRLFPSTRLLPAVMLVLFVVHTLIVAGDAERKLIGTYPALFEGAWKHAVQLTLSVVFVGLFWLVLALGAGLFHLIDLDFPKRQLEYRWFAMPATSLAFACAVHVTGVRAGIVRGVRTLIHVLLSWLLPLMALFTAGFLASLPFTGLAPLWSTRFATSLLLAAAFASVLLVNATYQDGEPDRAVPWLLRQAASLASLVLVPLVALATYALALRVEQHGWTSDRIFAAAAVAVAAICALGYAWAVLRRGPWLKGVEVCNVVAAFVALGAVLALYSPISDPARISVADQLARLEADKTSVADFDFAYLRFDGGRYGQAALERLRDVQTGPDAADIRQRATNALAQVNRWERGDNPPTAQSLAQHITVYPAGRTFPDSFLRQDWSANATQRWMLPQCLVSAGGQCDAVFLAFTGTGAEDIVLFDSGTGAARAAVFRQDIDGKWQIGGSVSEDLWCPSVRDGLRSGQFKIVPPAFQELDVDGYRIRFTDNTPVARCP
jgi:hypothetical protein